MRKMKQMEAGISSPLIVINGGELTDRIPVSGRMANISSSTMSTGNLMKDLRRAQEEIDRANAKPLKQNMFRAV